MGSTEDPKSAEAEHSPLPDATTNVQANFSGAINKTATDTSAACHLVMENPDYQAALDKFLSDFLSQDEYAKLISTKLQVAESTGVLAKIKQIYEETGIDFIREAFFQYFQKHGKLPDFFMAAQNQSPNIKSLYEDDARLHSKADEALGEYIDNWRDLIPNLTQEQIKWCKIAEDVNEKAGLGEKTENEMADMLNAKIDGMAEKPDVLIMAPSSNSQKSHEEYQMYGMAQKVETLSGIKLNNKLVNKTKTTGDAKEIQGNLKYFDRRQSISDSFKVDEAGVGGKTILILDDGWSSGSTVDEMKKVLYLAGAKKVNSLHLVRC